MTRPSRLAKSATRCIQKNGPIVLTSFPMYGPMRTFGFLATLCFALGAVLVVRIVDFYFQAPETSGHIRSLQIGVEFTVIAFIIYRLTILSDRMAANRRLTVGILANCRNIEAPIERPEDINPNNLDILATGDAPGQGSARRQDRHSSAVEF